MTGPKSYWLSDGQKIFAYDTQSTDRPPWIIVKQGNGNRNSKKFGDGARYVVRYRKEGLRRYKTETEARSALHQYAKEHNLRPAY